MVLQDLVVPDVTARRHSPTTVYRLEKIDIRGNPFKDIPDVAAALSTIPNLKHLFMTLKAEADEDALFSFLPKVALPAAAAAAPPPPAPPFATTVAPRVSHSAFLWQLETINGTSIPQQAGALQAERDTGAGAEATAISEQACNPTPMR